MYGKKKKNTKKKKELIGESWGKKDKIGSQILECPNLVHYQEI